MVGVVHVEIDHRRPLVWSTRRHDETIARILSLADNERFSEIQIDFEVRVSHRPILLGVRAGLAAGRNLSMTALASWCDTERWLASAPVGEIVPMLFRTGPTGEDLKRRCLSAPWVPAFEAVIQLQNLALSCSYPSFPRKQEPRDFSHLLLGPHFRGGLSGENLPARQSGIGLVSNHAKVVLAGLVPWAFSPRTGSVGIHVFRRPKQRRGCADQVRARRLQIALCASWTCVGRRHIFPGRPCTFAGTTSSACPQDFLTGSFAGKTRKHVIPGKVV